MCNIMTLVPLAYCAPKPFGRVETTVNTIKHSSKACMCTGIYLRVHLKTICGRYYYPCCTPWNMKAQIHRFAEQINAWYLANLRLPLEDPVFTWILENKIAEMFEIKNSYGSPCESCLEPPKPTEMTWKDEFPWKDPFPGYGRFTDRCLLGHRLVLPLEKGKEKEVPPMGPRDPTKHVQWMGFAL